MFSWFAIPTSHSVMSPHFELHLHPVPQLLPAAILQLLLQLSLVLLLHLPGLDTFKLLLITIIKGPLLLVQKTFDITRNPGLIVCIAAYRSGIIMPIQKLMGSIVQLTISSSVPTVRPLQYTLVCSFEAVSQSLHCLKRPLPECVWLWKTSSLLVCIETESELGCGLLSPVQAAVWWRCMRPLHLHTVNQ